MLRLKLATRAPRERDEDVVRRAADWMRQHVTERVKLADLARTAPTPRGSGSAPRLADRLRPRTEWHGPALGRDHRKPRDGRATRAPGNPHGRGGGAAASPIPPSSTL